MIRHHCPNCGAQLDIPEQLAGQTVECGGCGAAFQCPAREAPPVISAVPETGPETPPTGSSGVLALASLTLAILSFACMGFVGAIPAVILGHVCLSKIRQGMMPPGARVMAVSGLILGYSNLALTALLVIAGVGMYLFSSFGLVQSRNAAVLSSCQNNLRQMALVFKMFANESRDGMFPELSGTPGKLTPILKEIYPEYLMDPPVLLCPAEENLEEKRGAFGKMVDDESYFYLGYAVTNDEEMALFADAYREWTRKRRPFDDDLPLPEGKGPGGGGKLHRLREGVERFYVPDADRVEAHKMRSIIPLMIERPDNHMPKGGNVLFMDGHVEFLRYPGQWPMTQKTMGLLLELGAMGG